MVWHRVLARELGLSAFDPPCLWPSHISPVDKEYPERPSGNAHPWSSWDTWCMSLHPGTCLVGLLLQGGAVACMLGSAVGQQGAHCTQPRPALSVQGGPSLCCVCCEGPECSTGHPVSSARWTLCSLASTAGIIP